MDSLSPLEHDGLVRIWTDRKLGGLDSEGWEKNLLRNLKEAGYILVLWSPSFSSSAYCRKELDFALERKRTGADKTISGSADKDEALWQIADEILRDLRAALPPSPPSESRSCPVRRRKYWHTRLSLSELFGALPSTLVGVVPRR